MKKQLNLMTLDWQLRGWRPNAWKLNQLVDKKDQFPPHISPMGVTLPTSVQRALLENGLLPDWNEGLNSNSCEWVEHRHWEFYTTLPRIAKAPDDPIVLECEGLDYSGCIIIDDSEVGRFEGTLVCHKFDLTEPLADGKEHVLRIIFVEPPREQGQIGVTSLSSYYKPRFSYSWDWCPRFVPVGIWDDLYLRIGEDPVVVQSISATLNSDNRTGQVDLALENHQGPCTLSLVLSKGGDAVVSTRHDLTPGNSVIRVSVPNVSPWWPNGVGRQDLYDLAVFLKAADGTDTILRNTTIGFKRVEWEACEGAPSAAIPWICRINGKPVFLQGVNWTPVKMDYPSLKNREYETLVKMYREMGCNLLRVWGGAYLEKEVFYRLCDEAGILVWQEFPLSSSGIENRAPEDPCSINRVCDIARSYIRRRGHHVCKLLWCGGNELHDISGEKNGGGTPLDLAHPCLRALSNVVRQYDPHTRFIPTSPSGPSFSGDEKDFGKGIHHDVHGPWKMNGTLEEWEDYWQRDDSLLRSEVGVPGASSLDLIDKYLGRTNAWPPSENNEYWRHSSLWWIQWSQLQNKIHGHDEREKLLDYISVSQELQAQALKIAAQCCKARFPRCGGFIVWMGHDAFPCPSNTSIIDFDRRPKPAFFALREVFVSTTVSNNSSEPTNTTAD